MRSVDLALYADALAARAAATAAQLERARDALRQAALERRARRALGPETVARLERLGLLSRRDRSGLQAEVAELAADVAAIEELEAWVERRLAVARDDDARRDGTTSAPIPLRAADASGASEAGQRGASATRSPPSSS